VSWRGHGLGDSAFRSNWQALHFVGDSTVGLDLRMLPVLGGVKTSRGGADE